ncbi:MAG: AAA family ATPase [Nitrosomonadaceae bacterium]
MSERNIVAALIQSRKAYDAVIPYHDEGDFSDMAELVFKELVKYYDRDADATCMDVQSLLSRLGRAYPKHTERFESFLNGMTDVSVDNILDDYRAMKSDSLGELIGGYLIAKEHGKAEPLLDKYNRIQADGLVDSDDAPVVYADADVTSFAGEVSKGSRIPIAPRELNEAFGGGLIVGSHTLIYAPPETGKTAFAINMAYSIACHKRSRQGDRCLYIGNEESAAMYMMRLLCRFTQWEADEVQDDPEGAMELARSRGWENLTFVHLTPGTIAQVQSLILEHKPKVCIIDQLPNLILGGKGKEPEKTQLLERLAYVMRMFYSRNKVAGVSMSQADEKAIGKMYLTIRDVYYSNIGVQGQCDAMVGIGMDAKAQATGRRMLCITKNKLGGEHINIQVLLNHKLSAFKSVG